MAQAYVLTPSLIESGSFCTAIESYSIVRSEWFVGWCLSDSGTNLPTTKGLGAHHLAEDSPWK